MTGRRSMGQALSLTPEKVAFIKGDAAAPAADIDAPSEIEPTATPVRTLQRRKPQRPTGAAAAKKPSQPSVANRSTTSERVSRAASQAEAVLDQIHVPVTARLKHRTVQALRRAYLEQKLRHAEPATQQEIIEEAVVDWLRDHDYLK